jgi:hypothetical protein
MANLVGSLAFFRLSEKSTVPFFPEKKHRKSVENPEKGFRPVRSCQTHPTVSKYIQKHKLKPKKVF